MLNYKSYKYKFHGHLNKLWPSGCNGGLVIWRPCGVGGSNPTVYNFFCNVYLFSVPLSWTGSVKMKASMTFVRGNRGASREKDNFKCREVKPFKGVRTSFNSEYQCEC